MTLPEDPKLPEVSADPVVSPLDEIVDDLEPRAAAIEWACEQFRAGQTAESVASKLISQGWSPELAEELAEEARKATRFERGMLTRNDVVSAERARFQQAMGLRWFSGWPALASLWRVLASIRRVRDQRTRH